MAASSFCHLSARKISQPPTAQNGNGEEGALHRCTQEEKGEADERAPATSGGERDEARTHHPDNEVRSRIRCHFGGSCMERWIEAHASDDQGDGHAHAQSRRAQGNGPLAVVDPL